MPPEGACLGPSAEAESRHHGRPCTPWSQAVGLKGGKPPPREPQRWRNTQNHISRPWTARAYFAQTALHFPFPIFYWHLLLKRHFSIRSGTPKPVQQAALEISQPRDDSQGSDGTRVVHTSWVAAPLQPFTGCHLTGVIFSEASAVTVIFPVFRKC